MADERREDLVRRFFSGTGPTYDRIVHLSTLGVDRYWKKKILNLIPEHPTSILDQACGTGILTFEIARRFPGCRVTGVDLTKEYLTAAKEKAMKMNLRNVEFILGKAEEVFLDGRFDCITSSYLAKYADLQTLIRNNGEMLRAGGMLMMHDFTYPARRLPAGILDLYFKLLRKIGNWKYPQWKTVLHELPELMKKTDWVPTLISLLKENRFSEIRVDSLTFGVSTLVSATKL